MKANANQSFRSARRRLLPVFVVGLLFVVAGYALVLHGAKLRRDNRTGEMVFIESEEQAAQAMASRPNQQALRGTYTGDGETKAVLVFDPDPVRERLMSRGNEFGLGGAVVAVTGFLMVSCVGVILAVSRWRSKRP